MYLYIFVEVTSLRQQLIDFQAQSDEKTIIGNYVFQQESNVIRVDQSKLMEILIIS